MISFDDYDKICKDLNKEIPKKTIENEKQPLKNIKNLKTKDDMVNKLTPKYKVLVKANFV